MHALFSTLRQVDNLVTSLSIVIIITIAITTTIMAGRPTNALMLIKRFVSPCPLWCVGVMYVL